MQVHDPIRITTRDRVLRAWQNTTELVRDFRLYAREVEDPDLSATFARFAEEEGHHAATFHALLMTMEK